MNPAAAKTATALRLVLCQVACVVFGAATAAGQSGSGDWNALPGSSQPWGGSPPRTGSGLAVIQDRLVIPSGHTAGSGGDIPSAPLRDRMTQPWFPEETVAGSTPGSARSGDPAPELNIDVDESRPGGRGGWNAGIQEMLRRQLGSLNWQRMLTSLGLVIGGYLGLVWFFRLAAPRRGGRLPAAVCDLVGSVRLNSRQSLQLVRVGSRLLMLIVSPEGAQAVGEISHPGEVEKLVSQCGRRNVRKSDRAREAATAFVPSAAGRSQDSSQPLEQLIQSLQQAVARHSPPREFEA